MNNEITILIHGFNKNKNDMSYVKMCLENSSYQVCSVNLPTLFGSMDDCVNSMFLQIGEFIDQYQKVNFVAHSMGGLITLNFIKKYQLKNVGRCVFIATPHKGSRLAEIANSIPLYSNFFKPIKELLPNTKYENILSELNLQVGIIAGHDNSDILGKVFLSSWSDGRVEVESAKIFGSEDFILLPYGHKLIHHKKETYIRVMTFLAEGKFK